MRSRSIDLKSEAQETIVRAVVDVTSDMPRAKLIGFAGLCELIERLADRELPASDVLAKARLRGILAQRQLLSAEGGGLTVAQVASLLGISRQAVDKRRKAGRLLAVDLPKRGLLYPVWQFNEEGELPGFSDVMHTLRTHSPWAQARFFVSGNQRLGGKKPIELLREGNIALVLRAAKAFGDHGAA